MQQNQRGARACSQVAHASAIEVDPALFHAVAQACGGANWDWQNFIHDKTFSPGGTTLSSLLEST
jgi:hypothetical protein